MAEQSAAIVQYQGHPSNAVEQIMKQAVAENSNTLYRNNNILLMMWIYDNEELREEVLQDWMVEWMNRADSLDQATNGTRQNHPAVRQA